MGTKKLLLITIFAFIFLNSLFLFVLAQNLSLYNDFPVYPPSELTEEIRTSNKNSINLQLISKELRMKLARHRDHSLFESGNLEIKEAIDYLEKEATGIGWMKIDNGIYSDGGSNYLIFAKKEKDRISIVGVDMWRPMMIDGYEIPEIWGTVTYNFSEYPMPFVHNEFPLFPSIKGINECRIAKDFYGNEVVTIDQGQLFQGIEPFGFLYKNQSVLPKLYQWSNDPTISFEKDYSKGSQLFFLKNNNVVKVVEDFNNKSVIFTFFTPAQSQEIIMTKTQKSPTKQELLMEKLKQMPKLEDKSGKGNLKN